MVRVQEKPVTSEWKKKTVLTQLEVLNVGFLANITKNHDEPPVVVSTYLLEQW